MLEMDAPFQMGRANRVEGAVSPKRSRLGMTHSFRSNSTCTMQTCMALCLQVHISVPIQLVLDLCGHHVFLALLLQTISFEWPGIDRDTSKP